MSSNEQRAKKLAEDFRAEHALGEGPIKDMFELVHLSVSIDVLSVDAEQAEHGLTMLDPDTGTIVIAVATMAHPMRQRSSIAHELGHVLAGDLTSGTGAAPGERTPEEICADAFARHLLLPVSAVTRRLGQPKPVTLRHLSELVQEFEVSPGLAAIQMRNARLITRDVCEEFSAVSTATLATAYGWLSQYLSLVADAKHPRAPQALMARAADGYRRGVLGARELAGWYSQGADDIIARLGAPDVETDLDSDDDFWGPDTPLFADEPTTT